MIDGSLKLKWAQNLLCAISLIMLSAFWHGSAQVPVVVCNALTGGCTGVGGGSSLFTAATCDGNPAHDDAPAIASLNSFLNTWQATHSGLIEIDFPHGSTCEFIAASNCSGSTCPALGIKKLLVVCLGYTGNGDGCIWTDNGGAGGGIQTVASNTGICNVGIWETVAGQGVRGCSARIATASAGASCVTVITSNGLTLAELSGRFSVNGWLMVGGIDMMGNGAPPNNYFYEYRQITSVNTSTGVICFNGGLTHSYKSTWPLFDIGNDASGTPDQGGPATIWMENANWDTEVEYRGVTFDMAGQTNATGRQVVLQNVKMTGTACIVPSQNVSFTITNADMTSCGTGGALNWEIDKLVGTVSLTGITVHRITFQSSSADLVTISNSTVVTSLTGSPKKLVCNNSTFADFSVGAFSFGATTEVDSTGCTYTALEYGGLSDIKINQTAQMSGGVIKISNPVVVSSEANNGSGLVRLAVACTTLFSGCTTPAQSYFTGQHVFVQTTGGANCSADVSAATEWVLTAIDATHVDLQGSTSAGGTIGANCQMFTAGQFPPQWGVPGLNIVWNGFANGFVHAPPTCQINDMSQDQNFTYATLSGTGCSGGFPAYSGVARVDLFTHPAPVWNCTGCLGAGVAFLQGMPANQPLGSYANFVLDQAHQSFPGSSTTGAWGTLVSAIFNVTHTYGGVGSPLVDLGGPSVINPDGVTKSTWNPSIDPKTAVNCTITPTTSTCSGDSAPGAIWLVINQMTPEFTSSVTGDAVSVSVTIQTNQSVVPGP